MPTWPRRLERPAFWLGVALVIVGCVAGVLLLIRLWPPPPTWGFPGFQGPLAISFGATGALLISRRPGNVIGWILLAEGAVTALQFPIDLAAPALAAAGAGDPAVAWAGWLSYWYWVLPVSLFGPLFLLFPDGRPPSPRWRILVPTVAVGALVVVIGLMLSPGAFAGAPYLNLSFGGLGNIVIAVGLTALIGALLLCAASLVVRWRRSSGDAREQLKWLAVVSVPFVVAGGFAAVSPVAAMVMIGFGMAAPVAIAMAVLRHRLYDIDQVISKTVVYGSLTAILAGLYSATLKLFQELFVQLTGTESDGAVILSTLVIAATFTPVRKALERIIERRFKPAPAAKESAAGGVDLAILEAVVRRAVREELAASKAEA